MFSMLETQRLILRNYTKEDFERVHAYASMPLFSQYDVWGPNTEEDTIKFLNDNIEKSQVENRFEFTFAICLKDNGLLIGGCGLVRESEKSAIASIGYSIHPDHQSLGYATECSHSLINYGFNILGLEVIYATCDSRNSASYRVMEKIGMIRVGHFLKNKRIRGALRDSFRYELLKENYIN
jgi:RimJ/RimL family protein N-acetyltransferase